MRPLLALAVPAAAALAACGDDELPDDGADATAAIARYELRFDVTTRAARATAIAVLETPGRCLALPFRGEGVDPASARVDGAPAAAGSTFTGAALRLCGDRARAAGDTVALEVEHVVPLRTLEDSQVGYSVTLDRDGNPFHYLVSWVEGCDRFAPCDVRPDRFARYTFHVTHPPELIARCPGAITAVSPTETRCDFDLDGGPTYSTFSLAAYPAAAWPRTELGAWGSARAVLYDRPGTGIAAAIDPAYHAGFVAFLESQLGPYPYGDELRVLTAPTYWSGFEHPGNIVLDDLLALGGAPYLDPVAHVLDHEIAHMWAGGQTTLAGTHDFVWKEAMAEYLTFVYEEAAAPAAAAVTAAVWKALSAGARYFPVPGEAPRLFDYYGDVYGPGPMVLFRQLEAMTSRAQVMAALRAVLGRPRALSVAELLAALEASTGLDLDAYAAAWIYGTGAPVWPEVALAYEPGGATDRLTVRLTAGQARRCAFHVGLRGAAPGERWLVRVDTRAGLEQTILVSPQPPFAIEAIELDPLRECLVFPPGTAAAAGAAPRAHPWRSPRAR